LAAKIQKSFVLGEIWFSSRFWCWELISMVWCTLVTMATAAILNFVQPPKNCHILRWIFLQSGL
jgi:hypothetical protein